ncbi:hypothetical protein QUA41_31055 [Microcoleus sp. Pol11C1]|uniref:hypothetical protein n=1 Tax=unclassified Microcoleus TaxID=2642155 RepID=UPI002FCF66F1
MIAPDSQDKNLLIERVTAFLSYFELVFDNDWWFTKSTICDDPEFRELFIAKNGTFLNPFPGEFFYGGKSDNWANRTQLLDKYRELRAFLISEGLYEAENPNMF